MSTKITVLLADDHTLVRQGLRALLAAEPDLEVVGEAENGRQAVELTRKLRPDVVLMDIAMTQLNGLEATRQIVAAGLPSKVVILSSYGDDEYVNRLTQVGASGYLVKQTAVTDVVTAIREAKKGNSYLSPSISKRILDVYRRAFRDGRTPRRQGELLTARELEVLQLVAEGWTNKQIASELHLSVKTIEKHRQQVMDKLDIHTAAGLTRYAVAKGIVTGAPESPLRDDSVASSP